MVNEEIVGGLMSALSRGESLQAAMMTFFNAGYDKKEIEDAAKIVYTHSEGIDTSSSLQNPIKAIAAKAGLIKKPIPAKPAVKLAPPTPPSPPMIEVQEQVSKEKEETPEEEPSSEEEKFVFEEEKKIGREDRAIQKGLVKKEKEYGKVVYHGANEIASKLERAIRDLKQINIPSKIEIVNKGGNLNQSGVVQRVSGYGEKPLKPVSKAVTYLLILILIALLGILAAVFFFKDDLINIFNNIGLS